MKHSIDLLFAVGFLLVVIKGADIILRPHQEKWLQDKLETFTLWISEQKPLSWFTLISKPAVFTALTIFIGGPLAYTLGKPLFRIGARTNILLFFGVVVLSFRNFKWAKEWGNASIDYITGRLEPKKDYSVLDFLNRLLVTIFKFSLICVGLAAVAYVLFKLLFVLMDGDSFRIDWDLARISFIPGWQFIFFLYTTIVAGVIVIMGWIILLGFEILLKVLRFIFWRIIEFSKGVVAAIILIVTLVLGVIELYLKLRK